MNAAPRLEAMLRLNAVRGLSTLASLRLWERLGERFHGAGEHELAIAGEIALETASHARRQAADFDVGAELAKADKAGARVICLGDPEYPQLLSSIIDPPLMLYVKGEADFNGPGTPLAFVGSRRASPYGLRMAKALALDAAKAGAIIVSGLARGIDSEAHKAALEAGARTWAVLGTGIDLIYPAENAKLAERIVSSGGAVISEGPMGLAPYPGCFPRRNRIISGLSWGTVVVEGSDRSGSLITARLAVEQGREVFAVPGPADSPLGFAPHLLLKEGAKLTCRMSDVWDELPPGTMPGMSLYDATRVAPGQKTTALSSEQRKILEWLGPDARTLDELVLATGIDLSRLSNIIFEMELRDLVVPVPGQRYAKKGS